MWPSPPSLLAWASSIFSQSFFQALRPFSPGHWDPNDVLDAQSISWQLQHLSPWESCPQRWPQYWCNSSSPSIMSGFGFRWGGGQCRVVGIVWVEGEGAPTLCSKKRLPTTQTDMLTANTNIAKQMVHAYLFRLPFKCTPQLCESALSSIEGRTYQLPSSPRYKGNLSLGNNERASLVSWLRVSAAPCYISMAIHQCRTLQKW